jgi:hypothetical protein
MQAARPAAIQWTDEEASHVPSVLRFEIAITICRKLGSNGITVPIPRTIRMTLVYSRNIGSGSADVLGESLT